MDEEEARNTDRKTKGKIEEDKEGKLEMVNVKIVD